MSGNRSGAAPAVVPDGADLVDLAAAAAGCTACELYRDATQTVFGAGSSGAQLMLIGEQPGDSEDLAGLPFVGPAGKLLDQALERAGIVRENAYVTNAVKHFRFKSTEGSTRRIHATPGAGHIDACRPWLRAEIADVDPVGIVALGATAAQSLLGKTFRVTQQRGQVLPWPPETGPYAGTPATRTRFVLATVHPSSILRGDPAERAAGLAGLVADLRVAAQAGTDTAIS